MSPLGEADPAPDRAAISGRTSIVPLIGHPVAQVKTPGPMNRAFAGRCVDAVMIPLELEPASVPGFFEVFRRCANGAGVSVTVPHKQAAFAAMDRVTPRAAAVRAVNIVRRDPDGTLVGDMTDGLAFVAALHGHGVDPAGSHLLLIGAGGAGSAIADAVAAAGAASVTVIDPDAARASALAEGLEQRHPELAVHRGLRPGAPIDIAANASPLGMRPDDPLPFDPAMLPPGALAADAVTAPPVTPWLDQARRRGHPILTGLDMALAQLPFQLAHLGT
ncbi:shikimate dehydrogenase family protein [Inquilinus sp. NPDC058860]|uniref:shikimate dehydrogenase family protein n=1 Tax=Inquilinus sp. NPDC058860 TaxID=3346652 RepID=UPI00368EE058